MESEIARPSTKPETACQQDIAWLENVLPRILRRLLDVENLDMPLLQLPLAQLRLAQALYAEEPASEAGETMGRLSERLGVRQNALTQAADRLVNHGLAERLSDPCDRRVVRLRLTQRGHDWVHQRRSRRHAHLQALYASLEEAERAEFLQAVRVLDSIAQRSPAREPGDVLSEEPRSSRNEPDNAASESGDVPCRIQPTLEETLCRISADAYNAE